MNKRQLLLHYAYRCRGLMIFSLCSGIVASFLNSIGTTLAIPIILSILDPSLLPIDDLPAVLSKPLSLFNYFQGDVKSILMALTILILIILKNVINVINSIGNSLLGKKLSNSLKLDMYKLVFEVDLDFFNKRKIGNILSTLGSESSRAASSVTSFLGLFKTSINMLIFAVILMSISVPITLITVVLLLLLTLSNQIFIKKAKIIGSKQRQVAREYSQTTIQTLHGIRLIKSVVREKQEYQKISDLIRKTEKLQLEAQYSRIFIQPINEIAGILIILSIVLIGKYLLVETAASLAATLLTYLLILFRALPLVSSINSQRTSLANQSSSVEVVHAFLNIKDKPFLPQGDRVYSCLQEGINFQQVGFHYPEFDQMVLNNVNLFIPQGKITALVGSSGSGKSTLGDLFARFYDPTEGIILFDGVDYRDFQLKSVRDKMAIVSQDTYLFNDTVRNNICYGLDSVAEEQIIDAAKRANAYNFIMELPQQFDTAIGDRGVLLSGGQKQRLAIARALLRNPELLLLDEATSALDTVSERLVQQALDELCVNRTTVVIAHRLSTIQNADQIVVLEKGEIKEIGNHEELLSKNGYYAKLYQMQFKKQVESVTTSQ